jgi:hypothetical protein
MTVAELIEKLKGFRQDAIITSLGPDGAEGIDIGTDIIVEFRTNRYADVLVEIPEFSVHISHAYREPGK